MISEQGRRNGFVIQEMPSCHDKSNPKIVHRNLITARIRLYDTPQAMLKQTVKQFPAEWKTQWSVAGLIMDTGYETLNLSMVHQTPSGISDKTKR